MAYCARDDVEMVYGATNVEKWADLDNDEDDDKISDRVDWAIEEAIERVDVRLRGGPYEVPFSTVPRTIQTLTARIAGIVLYDGRGITDQESGDRMAAERATVERAFTEIMGGRVRLDLDEASRAYPTVVDFD